MFVDGFIAFTFSSYEYSLSSQYSSSFFALSIAFLILVFPSFPRIFAIVPGAALILDVYFETHIAV